jgi:hypothetical protein
VFTVLAGYVRNDARQGYSALPCRQVLNAGAHGVYKTPIRYNQPWQIDRTPATESDVIIARKELAVCHPYQYAWRRPAVTRHLCDCENPWRPADTRTDDFYKVRVQDPAPARFAVGAAGAAVRAGHLRKQLRTGIHDLLRVRPVPAMIRNKTVYLVDHHHMVHTL